MVPWVCVRPPGWIGMDDVRAVSQLTRWAERAEDLGLDGIFVGDRMLAQATVREGVVYGASMLDAGVALAAIAARTERIRLGPLVLVLPFRHPITLAKLTASLDVVSNGRLVLGVGMGWNPAEFAALGIPRGERAARFEESLRLMRELWQGRSVTADRWWSFEDVSVAPLPMQAGGPPVWMASFSPGSALDWEEDVPESVHSVLDRVGRLADGWVPLVYSASHRRRIDPHVLGRAWDRVKDAASREGRTEPPRFVLSDWLYVLDGPASVRRCQEALRSFFAGDWEEAQRTYLIGSPDEVVQKIAGLTRFVDGVDAYVLTPLSSEPEQLDAVAELIAPQLRGEA